MIKFLVFLILFQILVLQLFKLDEYLFDNKIFEL